MMAPTVKEIKNPREFANRVRSEMAKALGVHTTEHNFLDIKLMMAAEKLKQPKGPSLVEFARMEKLFRLDFSSAQDYLAKFSAINRSHRYTPTSAISPSLMSHPLFSTLGNRRS